MTFDCEAKAHSRASKDFLTGKGPAAVVVQALGRIGWAGTALVRTGPERHEIYMRAVCPATVIRLAARAVDRASWAQSARQPGCGPIGDGAVVAPIVRALHGGPLSPQRP